VRVKLMSLHTHFVFLGLLTFGVILFTYANQFLNVELLGDCKQIECSFSFSGVSTCVSDTYSWNWSVFCVICLEYEFSRRHIYTCVVN